MNRLSFIGLRAPRTPRPRGRCGDTAVLRHRARVGLETLEDRCVPAVFNVIGTADILGAVTLTAPGVFNAPSLRAAIQAANATPGGNTINLTVAGKYNITLAPTTPNEADNAAGEFAILPTGGDLTIQNTSGGAVAVDGNHLSRVFDINPADSTDPAAKFLVTFQGFTIQNGVAFDPNSPDGPTSSGGGVRDQGIASLTLNNVVVTHNTSSADGGGVSMENTVSAPWTLTVNNSVVSDNGAGDAGGGLETDGLGTVVVSDSTIIGNTCVNQGAGIWLDGIANGNTFESATLTVTGSVVSDNQALVARNGNLFNDGGGIGNAGNDTNFAGTVTGVNIIDSTIENNSSAGVGGGFGDQNNQDTLNVQNSLFLNNTSGNGGGGIYFSGTTVTINNSELQGNSTGGSGGALLLGGPVTSSGTPVGTTASVLTLTNSTLAGNTAGTGGGGIALETTGTGSIIRNVTITGNRALNNAGANGGGIDAPDTFTGGVTLDSDTINANFATLGGGIFWGSEAPSTFAVQNTIVALNTALNGADVDSGLNVTDNGGNLIGNIATAFFTRTSGLDPLLGPLQKNGGPLVGAPGTQQVVQTEALLAGSTAIGAGVPGAPTTDERGFNRVNGRIDSGAFEFQALTSALTLTASPSPAQLGQPVTFTATISSKTPGTNVVPAGTVTFTIDGVPEAPVTLNKGVASLILPSLPVGGHTVTAAYAGDSNFSTSTGTGTLTINPVNTTLSATDTNSPVTFNSSSETLDLTANVTAGNGATINEGDVVFTVSGVSSGPIAVSGGKASDMLTLTRTSLLAAGNYPSGVSASYTDTATNHYAAAKATGAATVSAAMTTITLTSTHLNTTFNSTTAQAEMLSATVTSPTGGTINEGIVTFHIGASLTAIGNVTSGQTTTTLTLPAGFAAGSYPITATYTDTTNANGIVNYTSSTVAMSGTLIVVDPAASSGTGTAPAGTGTTTQPTAPVGSLSLFAIGLGPTGFDLFEIDSQGDVFAQSLSGAGLQLVAPSLQLRLALLSNEGILALLAGGNGQDYIIDVFEPFLPSIEPAVLAVLQP